MAGFFDKVTKFFASKPVRIAAGAAGLASGFGAFEDTGPLFGADTNFLKPETLIGAANVASGASAQYLGKGNTAVNLLQAGLGAYNVGQGFEKLGTFGDSLSKLRNELGMGVEAPAVPVGSSGPDHSTLSTAGMSPEGGGTFRVAGPVPASSGPVMADPTVSYSTGGGLQQTYKSPFDDEAFHRGRFNMNADATPGGAPPTGTSSAAAIKAPDVPRFGNVTRLGAGGELPLSVREGLFTQPEVPQIPAAAVAADPLPDLRGVTIPIPPPAVVGPENTKLPPGAALRGLEDAPVLYPGPGFMPTTDAPLSYPTAQPGDLPSNLRYSGSDGGVVAGGADRINAEQAAVYPGAPNAAGIEPTSALAPGKTMPSIQQELASKPLPDPGSVTKMADTKGITGWFERQIEKDPLRVLLAGSMLTNLFRTDPAEKAAKEYADRMARYEQQLDPNTPFAQSYKESYRQARQDQLEEARKKALDDYRAVMTARGMTDSSVFNQGIASIESSYASEAARVPQDAENAFISYQSGRMSAINAASTAAARPAAITAARGQPVNFAQSAYILGGGASGR